MIDKHCGFNGCGATPVVSFYDIMDINGRVDLHHNPPERLTFSIEHTWQNTVRCLELQYSVIHGNMVYFYVINL